MFFGVKTTDGRIFSAKKLFIQQYLMWSFHDYKNYRLLDIRG